jgi:hypothetical protein
MPLKDLNAMFKIQDGSFVVAGDDDVLCWSTQFPSVVSRRDVAVFDTTSMSTVADFVCSSEEVKSPLMINLPEFRHPDDSSFTLFLRLILKYVPSFAFLEPYVPVQGSVVFCTACNKYTQALKSANSDDLQCRFGHQARSPKSSPNSSSKLAASNTSVSVPLLASSSTSSFTSTSTSSSSESS